MAITKIAPVLRLTWTVRSLGQYCEFPLLFDEGGESLYYHGVYPRDLAPKEVKVSEVINSLSLNADMEVMGFSILCVDRIEGDSYLCLWLRPLGEQGWRPWENPNGDVFVPLRRVGVNYSDFAGMEFNPRSLERMTTTDMSPLMSDFIRALCDPERVFGTRDLEGVGELSRPSERECMRIWDERHPRVKEKA